MVVGLDYRDATLSVHDLLQELKTHPKVRPLLEGGERLEWGAKTIPSGGFHRSAHPASRPRSAAVRRRRRFGQHPHASRASTTPIESGRLAAEAAFAVGRRPRAGDAGGLASYDDAVSVRVHRE